MQDMDQIIGQRIRACRKAHKMSQTALAERLGIAWQQVQKYENGANRVSASRIWEIADLFQVPVSHFFEDITDDLNVTETAENLPISEQKALEVVNMFSSLGNAERDAVFDFLKSVSQTKTEKETASS